MSSKIVQRQLRIGNMSCVQCQNRIKKALRGLAGVKDVSVDSRTGIACITYDAESVSLETLFTPIEKLGYTVNAVDGQPLQRLSRVAACLAIIVLLFILLEFFGVLNLLVPDQLATTNMGYGMLFVIGLVTSLHCIAMCGGINLSQSIQRGSTKTNPQVDAQPNAQPNQATNAQTNMQTNMQTNAQTDQAISAQNNMQNSKRNKGKGRLSAFRPTCLYNLGRIVSYTAIGFLLGFVGMLFGAGIGLGLPALFQGLLKLFAGVVLLLMGISMLGIFPWLQRLTPRMPRLLAQKIDAEKARSRSPFFVGLLNGFMPCGPLQSMQVVALASGNPLVGALSLFFFSVGTVPLMLGLGSIVAALGAKFTQKVLLAGAVLVAVFGLAMLSQGVSLSGLLPPELLPPIVVALCVVGVVSAIPFPKMSQKAFATIATSGFAVVVLVASSLGAFAPVQIETPQASTSEESGSPNIVDGRQLITSTLAPGTYPNITVQAGIPVSWIIDAPEGTINGCNNRMLIEEYDIEHSFVPGENVIEFTPKTAGSLRYSCWMGMIKGSITVTEAKSPPT